MGCRKWGEGRESTGITLRRKGREGARMGEGRRESDVDAELE
jgi:hypothetical protein